MNQKTTLVASLLLGTSLLIAGCADVDDMENLNQNTQQNTEQTTQAESIKIGAIIPLTGNGAAYGEPMQKIAQIALDEINSANGVNGKKIEFVWEDGKCTGADASKAANKLINVDKVKIIFGGFCSSETLSVAPIAEQAKVLVLSSGSSSPDVTKAGDYIFRNYPSDLSQAKILAEAASKAGYKKVGIVAEQNDYTLGIEKAFTTRFEELGGKVEVQTYLPEDTDFRTALLKLKNIPVDALFIDPQTPANADLILKQLEEQEWKVPLIANDVIAGYQELIKKYSKTLEGTLTAEFNYDSTNPEFIKLSEKYKTLTGSELPYGTYASTYYDGIYILKEGLEKVGPDTDKLKDYLYSIKDRKGLAGSLTMDENGDPTSGHQLKTIKEGKVIPYTQS